MIMLRLRFKNFNYDSPISKVESYNYDSVLQLRFESRNYASATVQSFDSATFMVLKVIIMIMLQFRV